MPGFSVVPRWPSPSDVLRAARHRPQGPGVAKPRPRLLGPEWSQDWSRGQSGCPRLPRRWPALPPFTPRALPRAWPPHLNQGRTCIPQRPLAPGRGATEAQAGTLSLQGSQPRARSSGRQPRPGQPSRRAAVAPYASARWLHPEPWPLLAALRAGSQAQGTEGPCWGLSAPVPGSFGRHLCHPETATCPHTLSLGPSLQAPGLHSGA